MEIGSFALDGFLYLILFVVLLVLAIGSFFALPMIWFHVGYVSRKLSRIIELLEPPSRTNQKIVTKDEELKVTVKNGGWNCPSCGSNNPEIYDLCRECGQKVSKNNQFQRKGDV